MKHNVRIEEQFTDRVISEELLSSCRNHIESLQNLSYLTSTDATEPNQVRLNVKMMEWHLRNLFEVLLGPLRYLSNISVVSPPASPPAKPQVSPATTIVLKNEEGTQASCEGEFTTAPDRTIWPALVNIADDERLHRLLLKSHQMMTTARNSIPSKAFPLNAVSDWLDFSVAVRDEEHRRQLTQ